MKGISHKIECEMYNQMFHVCFHKDVMDRRFWLEISDQWNGVTKLMDNSDIVLWFEHDNYGIPISTLNHEVFHAIDFMFGNKGVEFDSKGTNEHWAYAIGWLTEKILDCSKLEFDYTNRS